MSATNLDPADCAAMIGSRRLTFLVALTLIGAACTRQESVTPVSPSSTAPTTTAVATTVATAVTEPVDATVVDTTVPEPTTTPPPITTPPPSGTPSSTPTEFFGGGDADGWLYLGRWTGNAWESALDGSQQPRTPALGIDEVLIHEIDLDPITGDLGATAEACSTGRNGPVITPNARAPEDPGFGYRSVAFGADWPTQPRQVALVDADVESYVTAGIAAFESIGVDASAGEIQQIVVADLDGDGDSESLVAFGGTGFSTLLLIDADSGAALIVARDGIAEAAPSTAASTTSAPNTWESYRTLAVADLNGDGLMEFVLHAWESEDDTSVVVHEYDGSEVTAVLTTSC